MNQFRPFPEARALARARRLSSRKAYARWVHDPAFPAGLPRSPETVYREHGWAGYPDWLGNGRRAPSLRPRPFEEARARARALGFTTGRRYMAWAHSPQCPPDMPLSPPNAYGESWQGWGDWLGTGKPRPKPRPKQWLPFEQAREYARAVAHKHNVRSEKRWREWVNGPHCPAGLPVSPDAVYRKHGWIDYDDWLAQPASVPFLPFQQARAFVRTLALKNSAQWNAWLKSDARPPHIPPAPMHTYRKTGWVGMRDWLGTEWKNGVSPRFLSFEQAREYARTQSGCRSSSMWRVWIKSPARPPFIPAAPAQTYKNNGWAGYSDWLGTTPEQARREGWERARALRLSLREHRLAEQQEQEQRARAMLRAARLHRENARLGAQQQRQNARLEAQQWRKDARSPRPPAPARFLPFDEAREVVRGLRLGSWAEWSRWAKSGQRPPNIPASPSIIYQDTGWMGFADWVGYTGRWTALSMCAYVEARGALLGEQCAVRARLVLLPSVLPPAVRAPLLMRLRAAFTLLSESARDAALSAVLCSVPAPREG